VKNDILYIHQQCRHVTAYVVFTTTKGLRFDGRSNNQKSLRSHTVT